MEKSIRVPREAARATHYRDSPPLANRRSVGRRSLRRIELDVIANEQIKVTVAIIIEKCATGTPADPVVENSGLARDVRKAVISVVVEQNVMTPETAEQIVPTVIIVVTYTNTSLPAGAREA